jgi:hypothetical protein
MRLIFGMQPHFDPTRKNTFEKNGRPPQKNEDDLKKIKSTSKNKIKNEDDLNKKIKNEDNLKINKNEDNLKIIRKLRRHKIK